MPTNPQSKSDADPKSARYEEQYRLQPGEDPENRLVLPFLKHLGQDQKQFWTAPTRFRVKDLKWIVPFAGVTAAFIASDSWMSRQVNPNHIQTSLHISDYGAYSLIGLGGASFLLGHVTRNDHLQETGLLSGEAALNSTAVAYLLKEVTQRQRPLEGNSNGNFFQGGASFPSEHSAIAWSIASVWAHEYPGWLSQTAAYSLATAITVSRVTAKQHFPSDVVVGSALGWYFGRQVYRTHHDPETGGAGWGSFLDQNTGDRRRNPADMASPYVPIDNWVYPLFDRLIATGFIRTAHTNLRPWTRMECARLLQEAEERLDEAGVERTQADTIYSALADEFRDELERQGGEANLGATVDSLYSRTTAISGSPLHDGFHFGQTIVNDYGRPYGQGINNVSGIAARAVAGPFAAFVQGEYQYAPSVPPESPQALQAEAVVDHVPYIVPSSIPGISRFRLQTATVAFQTSNVQFSFGQQSLWWGPTASGSFLFSNNSEPIPMFKVDTVAPFQIAGLSRLLGSVRTQFFIGQLSGQQWSISTGPGLPSQPWLHGSKISFQPTDNLELGFGFTAQFGGTGNPFTWHNFLRTFYSHAASTAQNPAKRLSEFDFSYRIPGLRNWLTFYMDSMVIDEYSPIGSTRPQINPGIYISHLPKLSKMELRFEGVTTDLNIPEHFGPGAVYWDGRYRSGYTNNGEIIGNWIGRRGRGEQAWATYSISPRNRIQFKYSHNSVDREFLDGGHLQDVSLSADLLLRHDFGIFGSVKYETWYFPLLSSKYQSNVATTLQITFWPRSKAQRK